jgi:hypothetical protein
VVACEELCRLVVMSNGLVNMSSHYTPTQSVGSRGGVHLHVGLRFFLHSLKVIGGLLASPMCLVAVMLVSVSTIPF